MKNLTDLEVFKLNKVQMNDVVGGEDISIKVHCKELLELAVCHDIETVPWTEEQWDKWADVYEENCM